MILIGFSVVSNLCKFCTSFFFCQLPILKDVLEVLGHYASVYIKKLCNDLLGQPNIVVLYPYLNAILMGIFREHKEIHCAVADLQLILLGVCHIVSPQSSSLVFFPLLL